MPIEMGLPAVTDLPALLEAMGEWQEDETPLQLHPGDIGWQHRFGSDQTAAALRTWSRAGRVLALGFLDSPEVLRVGLAPEAWDDEELAGRLLRDLADPTRGVLAEGPASVELPNGCLARGVLAGHGWREAESWTPLRRDLGPEVPECSLTVREVSADLVSLRTAVQRAAFDRSSFTEERWRQMAAGPAYADARDLLGYDDEGRPVAAVTVWSAGPGRPGLLEPMGVHRDHRGHGYGRDITLAAAAALRDLGSSSALVCTRSDNLAAVATYQAAGYLTLPERRDLCRPS